MSTRSIRRLWLRITNPIVIAFSPILITPIGLFAMGAF